MALLWFQYFNMYIWFISFIKLQWISADPQYGIWRWHLVIIYDDNKEPYIAGNPGRWTEVASDGLLQNSAKWIAGRETRVPQSIRQSKGGDLANKTSCLLMQRNKQDKQINSIQYFKTSNNDTNTSSLFQSRRIAIRFWISKPTHYGDAQCFQYTCIQLGVAI